MHDAIISQFLPLVPVRALACSGRYSGKLSTTLDDADVHPNTYQGFSTARVGL